MLDNRDLSNIYSLLNRTYNQIEFLLGLYKDLDLKASLPQTRPWAASPDLLRELAIYVRHHPMKNVVEFGSGVSTIVMARAIQLAGFDTIITSLEHEEQYMKITKDELFRHGVHQHVRLVYAPLRTIQIEQGSWLWYDDSELPENIDFLFIDGPPSAVQHLARYPACTAFNRVNGEIWLDDACRPDEQECVKLWASQYKLDGEIDLSRFEKGLAKLRKKNE